MKGSTRRTVSIVLVAALVALAGCGGLGQSDNGGAETGDDTATEEATATTTATEEAADTATATETSTDEATEATPTATATPTDEANDTTDDELTSLDQELLDSHALTLLRAGNYTAFVTTNESGSSTTTIAAVDLAGQGKYDQSTSSPGLSIEEYREPGTDTLYTQVGTGDDASYFSETATDNFTANQITESHLITDVNYERFGTDTVGDTTVQRYVANDVSSLNVSSDGWGGSVVTNISSVVLVDTDRKLIYEIDAEYTVQTSNGTTIDNAYSVSYSDVGSTNVTEPDWVSEAR